MLATMGCEVELAKHGGEAVDAMTSGTYDIVLMDLQMPEMDGMEVTRRIRQLEKAGRTPGGAESRVPFVALTASATLEYRADCLAVDMDDFLTKPCTQQKRWETLSLWVRAGESPDDRKCA
jgi:CheY-like chemotaxis protein